MESTRITENKETDFQIIACDDTPYTKQITDFGSGDTKVCKECGLEKPLSEFRVESKGIGNRKAVCKICMGTETPRKAYKRGNVSNDMIKAALEAAAYRIIKESM